MPKRASVVARSTRATVGERATGGGSVAVPAGATACAAAMGVLVAGGRGLGLGVGIGVAVGCGVGVPLGALIAPVGAGDSCPLPLKAPRTRRAMRHSGPTVKAQNWNRT